MKYIYRLYTHQNLADTWRDPDEIIEKDLAYFTSLKQAENYIKNRLGDLKVKLDKKGEWCYTKGGSWAVFYILKRCELQEEQCQ